MSARGQAGDRQALRLPVRPFLYTLDQVGTILDITVESLIRDYLFLVGRTPGLQKPDEIAARNIAPATSKPEWRVEEREFIRWMKRKGFQYVG